MKFLGKVLRGAVALAVVVTIVDAAIVVIALNT